MGLFKKLVAILICLSGALFLMVTYFAVHGSIFFAISQLGSGRWHAQRLARSVKNGCNLLPVKSYHLPSGKRSHNELENHHFQCVNPLILWQPLIAMLNYQRVSCFGFGKINSTHCALRFANPNAVLASLLSACLHFEGKAFGVRKAAAKWFPDFNLLTAAD